MTNKQIASTLDTTAYSKHVKLTNRQFNSVSASHNSGVSMAKCVRE